MPTAIQTYPITSFTGGLNLRANAMQLLPGESPDLLNVDLDPRGGLAMRNVLTAVNTIPLATVPVSLFTYFNASGTKQVLTHRSSGSPDCELLYSTGGNWTAIATPAAHTTATVHRAVTFGDITLAAPPELCFIQNGVNKAM